MKKSKKLLTIFTIVLVLVIWYFVFSAYFTINKSTDSIVMLSNHLIKIGESIEDTLLYPMENSKETTINGEKAEIFELHFKNNHETMSERLICYYAVTKKENIYRHDPSMEDNEWAQQ